MKAIQADITTLQVAAIYENGGAVGAVCHGPAALLNVTLTDGSHLIFGKNTAVFTNDEEEAGAKVIPADNFAKNAVRDGRLVTGQNPASAEKAGKLLVEALGKAD